MRRDCLFSEIPTFSIIMENYVNQLLKDADLAVVTKKHVRMKYKEHIGRELNHEEKSKINDMVYAFVKELSAASNQISSEPEPTEKTPISNEESPGNKENKQTNHKANTFIIKGQVVDRNDLYKSSSKKKPDKSPHEKEKQKMEETKVKGETPEQTKDRIHKQKAAAAKLKINEVMSAVLGPDKGESSSEVSDVSSLTDTSLSEEEVAPETEKHITEALEKLKAGRDKKIQMSIEKKSKMGEKEKVKTKTKARRSLKMESKSEKSKSKNIQDDSDNLSDDNDLSSIENDKTKKKLTRNGLKANNSSKRGKVKPNSDSDELTLKKTPQKYGKGKTLISDKETANHSEKRRKIVKRKRKVIVDDSDTESDTSDEDDLEKSEVKRKNLRQKRTVLKSKKEKDKIDSDSMSDSEDETLDKIAAKKSSNIKSGKEKLDKSRNEMKKKDNKKTGENEKKDNADEVGVNSDESTGDTPLVKKKKVKSKIDDDSDVSTGDTPLIKKKKVKSKTDDDSDVSTGDTPLVKKKKVKSKICNDSDVSTGDTPLIKKKKVKSKIDDDSDVSTGDTPLIKKKKVKSKIDDDSENDLASTPTVVKKDKKKTGQQDLSSVDSPLIKKKVKKNTKNSINDSDIDMGNEVIQKSVDVHKTSVEKDTETNHISDLNSVKRVKRKRELSDRSNASTSESPDIRRNKKLKQDKTPDKQHDFESEQSDVSTGDTPVVKKALRNSSVHLDEQDVEKEASERVKDDSNSSKNNIDDKESPCSPPENKENCDNTTDNDSPIKVVKKRGKVKRQLNSCSDEESPIVKPSKQKRKASSGRAVNGTSSQSDANSPNDSDNSDDDGDSSDDLPLAQIKHTVKTRVSDLSSDSEDDIPLSKTKAAQSKEVVTTKASKAKKQEENVPTSDMAYLRLLRQICRECQMFVRNDRELAGCNTDKEKIERLEQMLRDVGMKGKPTMKKAEEVRLMKEAKELSADNIISSETGRVMRKVKSIWARRTISPVKPVKPAHGNPFAGIQDIVDNEGTESD